MEYILNKTTTRTSNNYGINDIKLDLEVPVIKSFQNVTIIGEDVEKIKIETSNEIKSSFDTRIGLKTNQNYQINIVVPENVIIKNPIYIEYNLDEDNIALSEIVDVKYEKNSKASFFIQYKSENHGKYFHNLKQTVFMDENSEGNISVINGINDESDSFISIENELKENAKLTHILLELGGNNKISNYYSRLMGDNSKNFVKNIYIGTNNNTVDINYNIEAIGKSTLCKIQSEGAIDGSAKKNFKGIIDFKKGSTKSNGIENENCLILSDNAKSRSLPVLLCHEEDVYGEHGVASGKPDKNKLFYIMTKGISYDDARKLMVKANFRNVIENIEDINLQEEVDKIINSKLKESL